MKGPKSMNGVILINKSKNKTSRDMVNELNHIFDMKKIGHTGTLDPLATGVLVMCLGKYTKLVEELSSLEKEYIAKIKVGLKTDTLDITGNILEERDCEFFKEDVQNVINALKGKLIQTIPIYSAKKINGKKLYEYARSGKKVELPKNEIEIFNIELLEVSKDSITFKALVSKGTYIRSLIEQICDKLNIIGTMSELTRTKQGKFSLEDAFSIEDIKNGKYKLLTAKDLLPYQVYKLNEEEYARVKNGNKMFFDMNDKKIILEYDNKEIAIYERENDVYRVSIMLI
ncbi:MAG: tRNA pseudouridine(55) synthase TruB [Firmicutes bacterium]|nr:tRNA pseudouridine(55) synthase TruB [Bacillota bacterium]